MAVARKMWEFMFSPTLYNIYRDNGYQSLYDPNGFEKLGSQVINSFKVLWNVGLYSSPLIATIFYKKSYIVFESLALVTKILIGIGVILSTSYCLRSLGRLNNPTYINFYEVLVAAKKALNKDTKKALNRYDFDFKEWPVEFRWNDYLLSDNQSRFYVGVPTARTSTADSILSLPCQLLSFIAAKTFGIKMVYPGSIQFLQYFMFSVILQGRGKLIADYGGERFKLKTRDENDVDAIFINRRGRTSNGDILVICCEGNAGFYELGITMTPIEANYSVLGWNHPGFGGSTGTPFPSQEQNAVDCVMQFAIHQLKFMPENIVLFGWSIGGYTSTWAAMNYPDIRGMILDATFDDILPLAIPRMPPSWEPLVRRTIKDYINLNPYEQLRNYNGPVTFIRRTEDEIICTEEGNISTNRGNHLVLKFLKHRYPRIMDDKRQKLLNEWLASDIPQQNFVSNFQLILTSAQAKERKTFDRKKSVMPRYVLGLTTVPLYQVHAGTVEFFIKRKFKANPSNFVPTIGRAVQAVMWNRYDVDKDHCSTLLSSYIAENSKIFPMQIGEDFTDEMKNQMILYLVDAHLKNFRSTHCTPLPVNMFRIPELSVSDPSFVKL